MAWNEDRGKGERVEKLAEGYFKRRGIGYADKRLSPDCWKIDVDYETDKLGLVEVKKNYEPAARFGKKGKYFWIELEIEDGARGDKPGWWYFTKADHFLFLDFEGRGLLIGNDENFKKFINEAIENEDEHGEYGKHRKDRTMDGRENRAAFCMRVYLDDIPENVSFEPVYPIRKK